MEELNHHRALAGEYVGTLTNHTTPPPVRPSCLVISKRRGRYYSDPIPKRSGGHRSMLPPAGSEVGMDQDVWKSELSVFVSAKNVNMDIRIRIHF
jgi:hypothetical protein